MSTAHHVLIKAHADTEGRLPIPLMPSKSDSLLEATHADEHAPVLGSEGGIQEALGRYQTVLDEYRRHRLLPNMVGPYPTDHNPPKDVQQHLGQFAHTSHTYHDHIGVLR